MEEKIYEYDAVICAAEQKGGAYIVFPYNVREEFHAGRAKVRALYHRHPEGYPSENWQTAWRHCSCGNKAPALTARSFRFMEAMRMNLKHMQMSDKDFVMSIDSHVNDLQYKNRVDTQTGYIIWTDNIRAGLMHYSVLWDSLPFLNLIFVKETHRNKGIASKAMKLWEEDMKEQGYKMVLVSTQVDEDAQHLYRKLGYIECGALLMNGTPLEQPMEMFMRKIL